MAALESAVAQQPRFVRGLLALADLYEQDGRWADAARVYGRALQQGRGSANLRERHATALLNAGDAAGARDILRPLSAERQSDPSIWYLLSQAELRTNDLAAAEAAAQRVAELDPSDIRAPLTLARIFERQGRPARVVEALTTAIASAERRGAPARQMANLYVPLGFAHTQLGQHEEAVSVFERARSAVPDDPLLETYVIQALIEGRQFAQAAERARNARGRFPDDRRIVRLEARALQQSGQSERGIALLKDAVQQSSTDPEAHLALAGLYSDAERFGEAQAVLESAAKAFPDEPAFPFRLGAVFEQQKRYDEAERAFRQAIAGDPLHAPALNYLGYMFAERGVRLEESVELIQRALQVDPGNGSYLDSLGWAYFKLNKLDLAAENLRKAADRLQTNSVVQDHLGDVLARLNQSDEAMAAWERALAGDGEGIDRRAVERKIKGARDRGSRKPAR
jgi:tetratricopeptide (TPR) repeat protein